MIKILISTILTLLVYLSSAIVRAATLQGMIAAGPPCVESDEHKVLRLSPPRYIVLRTLAYYCLSLFTTMVLFLS
jgi:hypothetical protein